MLLRRLCRQLGNVQLRQFAGGPAIRERIPKPKALEVAIDSWQTKHTKELLKLIRARKISEATTYFYREVKTPCIHTFSVLIGAVGKTGHTELAFKLLRDMRARDIRPTPAILSALFTSCAKNTEDSQLAITKANSLYEQMALKGWHGNQITYHAMINAFARHGDTATCFRLLDEMQEKRVAVDSLTFNHLLMASVGDKKVGFVLALRVMRMMMWNRIKPSVSCYNNLLRAAAECGCGNNIELLNRLLSDVKKTQLKDPRVLQIESGTSLLDTRLSGDLISIAAIPKNAGERMALIGGVRGVLEQMEYFKLKPSSATCSMLLRSISSEKDLLEFLKLIPLRKMDIGFWNQLLKKCIVENYECASYIQKGLYRRGLEFDILTYGVLAMRVHSAEELAKFFKRMEAKDIVPNEIIMSTLINNVGRSFRFNTLFKLLRYCKDNEIPLNRAAIKNIATMLDVNEHAGVNGRIKNALRNIKIVEDEFRPRARQFDPVVFKRNKVRWDHDADEEDLEEMDRKLEAEAEQMKAGRKKVRNPPQRKNLPAYS